MNDTTFLIIIGFFILMSMTAWPAYERFKQNRARDQKKPETYHFTS